MAAMSNGHVANGAVNKTYSIHVANLPPTLEQDAIETIFKKYGNVTGVIAFSKKDNTQEAYISYTKYEEAETAINEMDKVPPLNLKIQFKDKELIRKNCDEQIEIHLNKPYLDHRYGEPPMTQHNQNLIKKSINMGKPKCTPSSYQVVKYTVDDELLYPVPTDPSMCNPYENPGPYKDLNLMYSRGVAQVLTDGRRRLCLGRGYTFYDLPEPNHNIGNLVANVCEIRNSGIYEYAPEDMDDESGNCKICSSPTAFRCQKCSITFYCSRPCQLKDWPQHKIECQSIPNLVKKVSSTTMLNGNEAVSRNGHAAPQKSQVDSHQREAEPQLRRPRPLPQHHQQHHQAPPQYQRQPSPSPSNNRDQNQQQSPLHLNRNQQQQQHTALTVHPEKVRPKSPVSVKSQSSGQCTNKKTNQQTPATAFKADSASFPAKQQNPSATTSTPSEDGFGFSKNDFYLSNDTFERVVINTKVDNGEYWVQKVECCDEIDDLFLKLEKHAKTKILMQPFVDLKCILEYEKAWYRAIIKDINESSMMVFLIDFGTYTEISPIQKVAAIDGFEEIPAFSRKIIFAENVDPKFYKLNTRDSVWVKSVSLCDNGAFTVELKGDEKQQASAPTPPATATPTPPATAAPATVTPTSPAAPVHQPPKQPSPWQIAVEKLETLPNVLDSLQVGQKGLVILHAQLAKNELNGSLVSDELFAPFESLMDTLAAECETQVTQNPNYDPIIGDFICGQHESLDWYRGIVISLNPVKLAVIDEARVFVPIKCTSLPKGYHDIVCFGLLVKLAANAELAGQSLNFEVLKAPPSNDSVLISLVNGETPYTGQATLTKWTPKPEQKGVQWAKLTSGCEVQIIEAFTQNLIYVHSKEPEEAERRHRLEQKIAKFALNRKSLRDLPVVGQIVMAYYENDGNYYRAYVVRAESKINIQIKYMDYGNDANVKFEFLFELPDELKEERACAARIKLMNVEENTPMTEDATAYLAELITHEAALTCTFTGSPAVDGVILKTSKNQIVNEQLTVFLTPTWQKHEKEVFEEPLFKISDLPCVKIGDVGDQVQAIVLCFYATPFPTLMLAPNDESVVRAIQEDLLERIQEYAKNNPNNYIPREQELCIALYDNVYYRGLCILSSASPTESRILFIDYGNTELVKHKDIRVMTKDFTSVGPLSTVCSLSPMVPDDKVTKAISDRLMELLPINELITIKIISEDSKDGTPYIDIPEVRVQLIDEKLL